MWVWEAGWVSLIWGAPVRGSLESFGVGANKEAHSSHRSANERLQLHCRLETRVKLYQSASPN